jgi:hypothetical protein
LRQGIARLGRGAAQKPGEALVNEDENVEIGGDLVGVDEHNEAVICSQE